MQSGKETDSILKIIIVLFKHVISLCSTNSAAADTWKITASRYWLQGYSTDLVLSEHCKFLLVQAIIHSSHLRWYTSILSVMKKNMLLFHDSWIRFFITLTDYVSAIQITLICIAPACKVISTFDAYTCKVIHTYMSRYLNRNNLQALPFGAFDGLTSIEYM
jgi:hypothetical protein